MDGAVLEQRLGHVVHVVSQLGLDEVVGDHRVPHRPGQHHAIVAKHLQVILDVLSDLQNRRVFVERFEDVHDFLRFLTFGGNSYVECLFFLHREAQTHQFGVDCRR